MPFHKTMETKDHTYTMALSLNERQIWLNCIIEPSLSLSLSLSLSFPQKNKKEKNLLVNQNLNGIRVTVATRVIKCPKCKIEGWIKCNARSRCLSFPHCKERKILTLNKQRLLFLIIFFSSAMNHANLYRVLFNFSVQYDFLYFLCNFAIFTFAPWNRQMNVFTHA